MMTIFRLILLIGLTSSCESISISEPTRDLAALVLTPAGGLDANVTQDSYRARENDNITLGWKFASRANVSLTSVPIHCELFREGEVTVLFQLLEGVAVHLVGRVQWDRDALRRGQISLQLSKLRMEDSGVYRCQVKTSTGVNSGKYRVIVTGRPAKWLHET